MSSTVGIHPGQTTLHRSHWVPDLNPTLKPVGPRAQPVFDPEPRNGGVRHPSRPVHEPTDTSFTPVPLLRTRKSLTVKNPEI